MIVGLPKDSRSIQKAKDAGLEVLYTRDAAEMADVIMVLVPDELAPGVYRDEIARFDRRPLRHRGSCARPRVRDGCQLHGGRTHIRTL